MNLKELIETVPLAEITNALNRLYCLDWHNIEVKQICDYLYNSISFFNDFTDEDMEEWLEGQYIGISRNPDNPNQIGALYCSHRKPEELIYNEIKIDNDINLSSSEILAHCIYAIQTNSECLFRTLEEKDELSHPEGKLRLMVKRGNMMIELSSFLGMEKKWKTWFYKRIKSINNNPNMSISKKLQLSEYYWEIKSFLDKWEDLSERKITGITKKDLYNVYKDKYKEVYYEGLPMASDSTVDYLINLINKYEDRDFLAMGSESIAIITIGNDHCHNGSEISTLKKIIQSRFPSPKIGIIIEEGNKLEIEVVIKEK